MSMGIMGINGLLLLIPDGLLFVVFIFYSFPRKCQTETFMFSTMFCTFICHISTNHIPHKVP